MESSLRNKNSRKLRQSRSTQTLLQSIHNSHYQLLEIIDRKANIVITVNSIILSLLMGSILIGVQRMDYIPPLTNIWPLIAATVGSLFFSILAIYPHRQQGNGKSVNYLFYENHVNLSSEQFREEINRIVDEEAVAEHLADDVHHLGHVLSRKNQYLRISLIVFTSGMLISVFLLLLVETA